MVNSVRNKPRSLKVIGSIGWVTFLEIVRDKVLYNFLLIAILLISVSILASHLSYYHPERVLIDFGLSAVALSCGVIGIFIGASLLGKELEKRTIHVVLCRPIKRSHFILGKFLGISSVVIANWLILSISYLLILGSFSPEGFKIVSPILLVGLILVLIQSFILASIAVLWSTISTVSLSVMITVGFYLIGINNSQILWIADHSENLIYRGLLKGVAAILPNFEYFNLGTQVTYGLEIPWHFVYLSALYGLVMIGSVLIMAGLLIHFREV